MISQAECFPPGCPGRPPGAAPLSSSCWPGMTIIELALITAILATLALLGTPVYLGARNKAMVVRAVAEVTTLQREIGAYQADRGVLPPTLPDAGVAWRDPWGNPYQYLNFSGASRGQMRKDRFLVPINSTYDLYSMGADGRTTGPLTARASRDDIIRANDGSFIGLAADF